MSSSTSSSRAGSENDWVCDSPKNEVKQFAPTEELSAILECPYCLDIPLPPVYLCLTGHIICSSCRETLNRCGLCTSAFTGTRNFFYENLFEKTTFACKYVAEGCKEVMLGKFLKDHQTNCDFRPIPCIKYGCANHKAGKYIAYSKYVNHFKEVHKAKFNLCRGGIVSNGYNSDSETWSISRWVHETYQFKGHTFFVNCQVRKPEVGIWLWLLGTESEAKNFRVNITLGSSESDGGITSWEGPVHSIRKSYESIMDSGHCLSTTVYAVQALRKEANNAQAQARAFWQVKFMIKEQKYAGVVPPRSRTMTTLDRPLRTQIPVIDAGHAENTTARNTELDETVSLIHLEEEAERARSAAIDELLNRRTRFTTPSPRRSILRLPSRIHRPIQ